MCVCGGGGGGGGEARGGAKSKEFWPTIKPFLSQTSTIKDDQNIILKEDEKLISVSFK